MPNRAYIKGRAKEQKIVRDAKNDGCIALRSAGSKSPIDVVIIDYKNKLIERSAGSKSPIDVVIIDYKNKLIELIQAKAGVFGGREREKLEDEFFFLNGKFNVEFKVL